jgi:hypothetical protein
MAQPVRSVKNEKRSPWAKWILIGTREMRSVCVFCGQRAKSVEHAWPRWLLEEVTEPSIPSTTEAQFGPDGSPVLNWDGPEITVKGVCVKCNTGWMSQLENEAKLTLTSLINDLSLPFTPATQARLSRWSMKTAMVFDSINRKQFYSAAERQQLRTSNVLPENTKIWLGRYGQSNLLCGEGRHLHENKLQERNPFGEGYVTTFIARRLVVQVLTVRRKPEFRSATAILHPKRGPWQVSLVEVWPITDATVHWPPTTSFSDGTIDFLQLSRRFTLLL